MFWPRKWIGLLIAASLMTAAVSFPRASAEDLMPLAEIMRLVSERYKGEITAAEVKPGKPHEETAFVYELRLVTPLSNVLRIRIDGLNGDFLEVDGRGLVEARKPVPAGVRP